MKMAFVWFFLSCKRYLKKPGILLALLLLPVTAWIAGNYVSTEKEGIKIALYLQENKAQDQNWKNMGDQLAEDLLNNSGMFQFYLCDSEEKLKDQVASGKVLSDPLLSHGKPDLYTCFCGHRTVGAIDPVDRAVVSALLLSSLRSLLRTSK